jgi:alpha-ribazole phosphatase/probable phosphoglycerate mutase
MQKTRLHLMRHGQVVGFENRRYNGQADVPLTDFGVTQSRTNAIRLKEIPLAAVCSSDLERCAFGARLIAADHQLALFEDRRLRELHIGAWEGLTWDVIQQRWPQEWQARLDDLVHVAPPAGESLLQLAARVRPALAELLARYRGQEFALVAHGGVNRVILLDALGAPLSQLFHLEQSYGCYNIIDYWGDGFATLQLLNQVGSDA